MSSFDEHARARERLADCFDQHESTVYGFLVARTGDRSTAEDLTTETFLAVTRRAAADPSTTDHLGPALLLTIARRRLIDHWREVAARDRRIRLARARSVTERGPWSGDDHVDARDERVIEALERLPVRQRGALTLRYVEDLSVSEVAEVLGLGLSATESLLARARRSFERALEQVEEDDL
ncbi:MAG: RNA polymerase sigma factor [Actinomycetota bacterium]